MDATAETAITPRAAHNLFIASPPCVLAAEGYPSRRSLRQRDRGSRRTVRKPPGAGAVPDTESEGLVSAPTSLVLASRSSTGLGPGWRPGPRRGTVRSPSSPMMLISLRRMPPKPRLLVPPIGEFTVEPCSDMTEAANDREHAVFLIADLDNSTDRRGHREGEASQPHLLHEDPIGSVGSGFAPHNPGPGHEPKPYVRTFPTPMEERRPLPRGVVKGTRHRPARRQAAGTLRLGTGSPQKVRGMCANRQRERVGREEGTRRAARRHVTIVPR